MAKQIVKKTATTNEETGVRIFQLPENVNAIQPSKMAKVIFVKGNILEVDVQDTVLLEYVRGIEGASDITDAIKSFRGE